MSEVTHSDFEQLGEIGGEEGKAAGVWATDEEGRILLQLRDDIPTIKMPGWMGLFGGHVEPGEGLAACAAREFAEETGIAISTDELIPQLVYRSQTQDNMLHYIFELTRRIRPTEIVVYEGAGYAFLTPTQFDRFPILPSVKTAALKLARL